jgi:hypothetical protein
MVFDVPGRADAYPWVAASGLFVAVAWGAGDGDKTDVFVAVSRDGGSTFGFPVQVNRIPGEARLGGELPPRVALTPTPGRSTPEMVVAWTARGRSTDIKLARSHDGGRTFGQSAILQSPGASSDRGWPAIALDRHAGIHAVWLDHRGLAATRMAETSPRRHDRGGQHDGVAMAQKSRLYYASVSPEPAAERALTPGVCYCCKTALAVGPDSSLYAAWRHVFPGNVRDMAFTMSRDGGRSFVPPVRVSEDGWAIDGCPDDGPAMTVDGRGTVHLVWMTVLDSDTSGGALFYASWNGRAFTPRVRIPTLGPAPAHPQIVSTRAERMFVAWDETVNGRRVAAMREIRIQKTRTPGSGELVTLSSSAPGTYPVLAATEKGLVAVWTAGRNPSRVEGRIIPTP